MQNRFSRLYNPKSGRIVMLAIDHGYFMGPTTGLERVDVRILPILPYCDALMLTRGMLRTTIPSTFHPGNGSPRQRRTQHPEGAVQRADCHGHRRCGASECLGACGASLRRCAEFEAQSVLNMTRLVDLGNRHGIPILAVTAVGKEMAA